MAKNDTRLGKGLGALLGEALDEEPRPRSGDRQVEVDRVRPNPFQPRSGVDTEALGELVDSIRENGLLQPLVVRPADDHWELVAGERRWRALKKLGWDRAPAVVRELEDDQMLVLALVENLQRENLSPIEEAVGYRQLVEKFGRLVEAYLDQAYAVASGIVGSSHAAEDAVQSAFLRALDRIDQLRPGSRFGPWFYRVLKSVCLNLERRNQRRSHEEIREELTAGSDDPEEDALLRLRRQEVLEALEALPEMQRMAVTLYDLEGYSHREVAEILDVKPATSRAHVHYGRKALREKLDRRSEESGG